MTPNVDLQSLAKTRLWTRRGSFPPSYALGDDIAIRADSVFGLGNGLFVLVNPVRGAGDQAYGVAWAESDYWASRALNGPQFRGDLTPPPPHWRPVPSLAFLGRPNSLSFGTISEFERRRTRNDPTLIRAHYRITTGDFLSFEIHGSDGIAYMYASNTPQAGDEPVAIEFGLKEAPRPWALFSKRR